MPHHARATQSVRLVDGDVANRLHLDHYRLHLGCHELITRRVARVGLRFDELVTSFHVIKDALASI